MANGTPEQKRMAQDALKGLPGNTDEVLDAAIAALTDLSSWDAESLQSVLRAALIDGMGIKPKFAFTPLRVAVTGRRPRC